MSYILTARNFDKYAQPFFPVLLAVLVGAVSAYMIAQVAVTQGWKSIFGIAGILFLVALSMRYMPIGIISIVIVFIAHCGFMQLTAERWIFLAVGLAPFLWRIISRHKEQIVLTKLHFLFFAFFAFVFLSSLWSENWLLTFSKAISLLMLFTVMLVVLYYHLKANPNHFRIFLKFLLYVNLGIVTAGFIADPARILSFTIYPRILGNPNSLGAFLALTLAFVVYQINNAKTKISQGLWFLFLMINILSLMGTLSRAGMLGGFISIGVYWFIRNRYGFFYFGSFVLFLGLMASAISPQFRAQTMRYFYKDTPSLLETRTSLWERQINTAKRYPLTGVGFGLSEGRGKEWQFQFSTGTALMEPGNSFTMLLEGTGFPGAVLGYLPWLILLGYALKRYIKLLPRGSLTHDEEAMCVLFSACLGGFFNCQFEGWLYTAGSMWAVIFWLEGALLLYIITKMEEEELGISSQATSEI